MAGYSHGRTTKYRHTSRVKGFASELARNRLKLEGDWSGDPEGLEMALGATMLVTDEFLQGTNFMRTGRGNRRDVCAQIVLEASTRQTQSERAYLGGSAVQMSFANASVMEGSTL